MKEGDILISIKGTLGSIAVATADLLPCNMNRDVAIIKPLHTAINSNYYMALFLMGKYGSLQSQRGGSGGVQQMITLGRLREFIVPKFSDEFYIKLRDTYNIFLGLIKSSKECFVSAETYLLEKLGINMSSIMNSGVSVKSFSESFGITGRLDAEYYQPKYDNFENHVLNYENGYTTPRDEFELIKTKCSRKLESYSYVEIGDIDIGNGSAEHNIVATDDLPTNAKIVTQKGDLLISTVRPYRGAVAILGENDLLVSGAFTVLRKKTNYPTHTLQVLFRTELYKDWLLKFNVGTSYPVIKDDDVLDIPIPVFSDDVHKQIKEYIQNSHKNLVRSRKLLECAKQAVEMAIEQDESTAITWLKTKISELTGE